MGAVTVMTEVPKFCPETVTVCAADSVPAQVEKDVTVPEIIILGSLNKLFKNVST